MGKSTLLQGIAAKIPSYHVCREGDYSPVELAWCAWMTEEEFDQMLVRYDSIRNEIKKKTIREGDHFIVCYTRILTDIPGFHKELEKYEIYNGRKTLQELEKIIFSRYQQFRETGYLFECSFLQNLVEELILFHQLSDDEIVEFYYSLYSTIKKEEFLLLYLYSDKLEETIKIIKKERSDAQGNEMWYPLMLSYLTDSPHGKQQGYRDHKDLICHLRHRQQIELRIINEIVGDRAVILPAKNWEIEEVTRLIL